MCAAIYLTQQLSIHLSPQILPLYPKHLVSQNFGESPLLCNPPPALPPLTTRSGGAPRGKGDVGRSSPRGGPLGLGTHSFPGRKAAEQRPARRRGRPEADLPGKPGGRSRPRVWRPAELSARAWDRTHTHPAAQAARALGRGPAGGERGRLGPTRAGEPRAAAGGGPGGPRRQPPALLPAPRPRSRAGTDLPAVSPGRSSTADPRL